MNKTKVVSLVILLAMVAAVPAPAREQRKITKKIEGENIFMFQELLLVLGEEEGRVLVQMAPPEDALPEKYEDVDLKAGDRILMMNGKRIKTTAAVQEIYEKLEAGDEIKLGVKRDEEMFIVTFTKEKPEDVSGRMIIRKTFKKEGNGETEEE